MENSGAWKLIPIGNKRCFGTAHELLVNMTEGIWPDAAVAAKGSFYSAFLNRLQFHVRIEKKGKTGAVGKPALEEKSNGVKKLFDEKKTEKMTLMDVEIV